MATHSSILAWRNPWTEEPGVLGGRKRIRHDLVAKQQENQKNECRQKRELGFGPGFTTVYNGLLDSEGEGEGGMIWENDILTCILSCKN